MMEVVDAANSEVQQTQINNNKQQWYVVEVDCAASIEANDAGVSDEIHPKL